MIWNAANSMFVPLEGHYARIIRGYLYVNEHGSARALPISGRQSAHELQVRPGALQGYRASRARKRASLSRSSISARLRRVISIPMPQYPVKTPASSYTGSPLME